MSTPRPFLRAASVILCRQPEAPEIFWVLRQPGHPVLGGFRSFPGGRISKGDAPAAWGVATDLPDAELRIGAIRELFEETGVLLARRRAAPHAPVTPAEAAALPRHEDLAAALAAAGLEPDLGALVPAGRWVTPPFGPVRFDAQFYLAWAPEGQPISLQDMELAEGAWIRPDLALDEWSANRALMAAPTLYAIRGLSAVGFEVEGGDGPMQLASAAEMLTGTPEAEGGEVSRVEIRPGLFVWPMRTRTLPPATHTNVHLVGHGGMVMVDPGGADADEVARLLAFVEQLGAEGRTVGEIWLTHHHPDHVGGAAAVAQALNVGVHAHPDTAARLSEFGVPVIPDLVDGHLKELRGMPGSDGWRLRVHHTPGHAPGHIVLHEEVSGSLLAGDMVSGVGFILIDPPSGHMGTYIKSLEKMKALGASALFPGHGSATGGVLERLDDYIAHRLEREAKVLTALAAGPAGVAELLPTVYADVEPALHPLAARSLLAHLYKLMEEGRVTERDERFERSGA